MCQEVITEDGKGLTTPRELANYLGMNCDPDPFRAGFDEEAWAEVLKEHPDADWRDCCLCGVDIEGICRKAGKEVEWDADPMILLIIGNTK